MYRFLLVLSLIIVSFSTAALADVKVRSRTTASGQSYESTTLIKGKRQRVDAMNGMSVTLTQCDLRRSVQMVPQTKTYTITTFEQPNAATTSAAAGVKTDGVVRAGGTVTTTVTVKDTGERKQMFGFTARRLIITTETVSSPDACNTQNMKMETDGWYIDAEFVLDCDMGAAYQNRSIASGKSGCQDKYSYKQVGGGRTGYPVYTKMRMFDAQGRETTSMETEVIELSSATLDAALFEIPQDYREAKNFADMYAGASSGLSTAAPTTPAQTPASTVPAAEADKPLGEKKPGMIRVGIAGVKTGAVNERINASDLAGAITGSLADHLKSPKIEVVVIDAKMPSAVDAEAREKQCDYVINATVSHKKGGGGFGSMLGSAVSSAIAHAPIGSTGSTAGNVAVGVARNTAYDVAMLSKNIRSKDELSLDVKLQPLSGKASLSKQFKAKANSDGEDLITRVVEMAVTEIFAVLN